MIRPSTVFGLLISAFFIYIPMTTVVGWKGSFCVAVGWTIGFLWTSNWTAGDEK